MSLLRDLSDAAAVARAMVRRARTRIGYIVPLAGGMVRYYTLDPERPEAVRQAVAAVEAVASASHHYEVVAALADSLLPIEKRDLAAHLLNSIAQESGQRRPAPKEPT